jgi:hypothetical protein
MQRNPSVEPIGSCPGKACMPSKSLAYHAPLLDQRMPGHLEHQSHFVLPIAL